MAYHTRGLILIILSYRRREYKYVNTDVMGEFALSGSIFLYCRNHKDFSDCKSCDLRASYGEKMPCLGNWRNFRIRSYLDSHGFG